MKNHEKYNLKGCAIGGNFLEHILLMAPWEFGEEKFVLCDTAM